MPRGIILAILVSATVTGASRAQGVPGGIAMPTNPGLVNTQDRQNEMHMLRRNREVLQGPAVALPPVHHPSRRAHPAR
jgi:hypothetical protein